MKHLILTLLLFTNTLLFAQPGKVPDSLLHKMCTAVSISSQDTDSGKVVEVFSDFLLPHVQHLTEQEIEEAMDYAYVRLQHSCKEFSLISSRLQPQKGDWQAVDQQPVSHINAELCEEFKKFSKLRYLETTGDTVTVVFSNGYWEDQFKDGSFSRLKMRWMNSCAFQIEFIESNNPLRKNFSKAGDKYNYQILQKERGYYLMSVQIDKQQRYSTFRFNY